MKPKPRRTASPRVGNTHGPVWGALWDQRQWSGENCRRLDISQSTLRALGEKGRTPYLDSDSVATKQRSALEPCLIEIDLGGKRLVFASFALNPQKLMDTMLESYGAAPGD